MPAPGRVAPPLFLGGLPFAPLLHANGGSRFSGSVLSTHYSLFTTHSRVQQGTDGSKAGEEFVGGGDVFGDLGAEFFGAAEFLFFAKTLPEVDLDAPRWEFAGRLDQMSFHTQARAIKRRANADVGHRTPRARFAVEASARHVDAPSGEQFLFGCDVKRRKSKAAPRAGS